MTAVGARAKRAIAIGAFSLVMAGAARDARALHLPNRVLGCSMCTGWDLPTSGEIVPAYVMFAILEGVPLGGGLITGIGSTVAVARGKRSDGWFRSAYVFGSLNALAATIWVTATGASDDPWTTSFATAHVSVAVIDFLVPTIGFVQAANARVAPVAVGGFDIGGRPWSGIGLQVSDF